MKTDNLFPDEGLNNIKEWLRARLNLVVLANTINTALRKRDTASLLDAGGTFRSMTREDVAEYHSAFFTLDDLPTIFCPDSWMYPGTLGTLFKEAQEATRLLNSKKLGLLLDRLPEVYAGAMRDYTPVYCVLAAPDHRKLDNAGPETIIRIPSYSEALSLLADFLAAVGTDSHLVLTFRKEYVGRPQKDVETQRLFIQEWVRRYREEVLPLFDQY